MNPSKKEMKYIYNEFRIMTLKPSHHVCRLLGVCAEVDREIWFILEYADGGSLKSYIELNHATLTHSARINLAIQATNAVHFLHTSEPPIVHRDIKSPNFLVHLEQGQYPRVVLSDFGLSKPTSLLNSNTNTIGTLKWSPPEVLGFRKHWSLKSDIYSLGMVIYEIFTGFVPFYEIADIGTLLSRIKSGKTPNIEHLPKVFYHMHSQFSNHSTGSLTDPHVMLGW